MSVLTIAITGMNARADNPGPGVAVARCLVECGRDDIRLVGLGYDALEPGLYLGDLFDATYLLPWPSAGKDAYLAHLREIHAIEHVDAIIPCLDAEIPACIASGPELRAMGIRTFLPDQAGFAMRSKDRLPEAAEAAGVATPETRRISGPGFFHACIAEGWSYPLVVKGAFYDAAIVHTPQQGIAAFERLAAQWGHPVLAQKLVTGEEFNLCAVGDGEGGMLGAVMMKKRAVTDKGKGWAGVCIADEALHDAAARLIRTLKWRGPCEVEAIRDRAGTHHLIEINPRFPAWVYFTHGVGRNLPAALLDLMWGRAPSFAPARVGSMFIRYAHDVIVPMAGFEAVVTNGSHTFAGATP